MSPSRPSTRNRVVFLDRDGVICEPPPQGSWVFSWDEFRFARGALDALRRLHQHGFVVAVVTNQSCVGRGLATLAQVEEINRRMAEAVAAAGGRLAGVFTCPHTDADDCPCRKPRPGLLDRAARELGLGTEGAFMVGDSERDIQAGLARGCTTILVRPSSERPAAATQAHHVVGSLAQAVDLILALCNDSPAREGSTK